MLRKRVFLCVTVLFLLASTAGAKDFKVAVMQLPTAESMQELFKVLGEVTKNNFNTVVVPAARTTFMLESDQVDIIFPATVSNNKDTLAKMKYDYSTVPVYNMPFVLYTNKAKPVDIDDLKKGGSKGAKIETTGSLVSLFEFTASQTTDIQASLKKVDEGWIDGLLYAMEIADPLLKNLGLKNIHRSLYSSNAVTFGIKKGSAGGELDKILADGIAKLRADGRLQKILESPFKNSTYVDWQQ